VHRRRRWQQEQVGDTPTGRSGTGELSSFYLLEQLDVSRNRFVVGLFSLTLLSIVSALASPGTAFTGLIADESSGGTALSQRQAGRGSEAAAGSNAFFLPKRPNVSQS